VPLRLVPLLHRHPPHILPHPINLRKPPDLARRPPIDTLNVRIHRPRLQRLRRPLFFQEFFILVLVLEVGNLDPLGSALDVAEDVVLVVAPLAVEVPQLRRALNACRAGLRDVNVLDAFFVGVLLDNLELR